MNQYKLPDLPYDFGASSRTSPEDHGTAPWEASRGLRKRRQRHLERLDEARTTEQFDRIPALERGAGVPPSGHILHSIFWRNLSPRAGGEPAGELKPPRKDFGGLPAFKRQFTR